MAKYNKMSMPLKDVKDKGGRTLLGDGIPHRDKVPRWKKA